MAAPEPAVQFRSLFEFFGDAAPDLPGFEVLPPDQVPQPYRDLLVHEHHMTVTLERFHGRPVEVRILRQVRTGNQYARMILLALEGGDEIVQFGIVRIDLSCCDEAVQAEILAGKTPLGRILIAHNVLRHIDPTAFLKITPDRAMMQWFEIEKVQPVYGRLATIYCNGLPAIELLEVVRPEKS